jgi:peptide-methionine (S)-S-oxide reductase
MKRFWNDHDPWLRSWSKQYQSAMYAHTDEQLLIALADAVGISKQKSRAIETLIEPLKTFYIAEDYHQKHYLQQFSTLMREFETYFSYFADFNNSPTVTKVNGFASGRGSRSELGQYLPRMQLSPQSVKLLHDRSMR